GTAVPDGYAQRLEEARAVYLHQLIRDHGDGTIRTLRPLPEGARVRLELLGPVPLAEAGAVAAGGEVAGAAATEPLTRSAAAVAGVSGPCAPAGCAAVALRARDAPGSPAADGVGCASGGAGRGEPLAALLRRFQPPAPPEAEDIPHAAAAGGSAEHACQAAVPARGVPHGAGHEGRSAQARPRGAGAAWATEAAAATPAASKQFR
ncbi:unnamed protein product, partial [Prorocentrum cordatum]